MATTIQPGVYSVSQILSVAKVDFAQANGDHRRVKIGKLGFDSVDDQLRVPEAADSVDIELDGEVIASLEVKKPEE